MRGPKLAHIILYLQINKPKARKAKALKRFAAPNDFKWVKVKKRGQYLRRTPEQVRICIFALCVYVLLSRRRASNSLPARASRLLNVYCVSVYIMGYCII